MQRAPELKSLSGSTTGFSRRAFWLMPAALAAGLVYLERPPRRLPDPALPGDGPPVDLVIFSDSGQQRAIVHTRKRLYPDTEWKRLLTSDEFAITRRAATEPPFTGRYWHTGHAGLYRCVCCGNALFQARTQFDSGTGWPSFYAPVAFQNIYIREDRSLAIEVRQEVLCSKCDAHLGHLFRDGPPPTGLRYCLNSPALRLVHSA